MKSIQLRKDDDHYEFLDRYLDAYLEDLESVYKICGKSLTDVFINQIFAFTLRVAGMAKIMCGEKAVALAYIRVDGEKYKENSFRLTFTPIDSNGNPLLNEQEVLSILICPKGDGEKKVLELGMSTVLSLSLLKKFPDSN